MSCPGYHPAGRTGLSHQAGRLPFSPNTPHLHSTFVLVQVLCVALSYPLFSGMSRLFRTLVRFLCTCTSTLLLNSPDSTNPENSDLSSSLHHRKNRVIAKSSSHWCTPGWPLLPLWGNSPPGDPLRDPGIRRRLPRQFAILFAMTYFYCGCTINRNLPRKKGVSCDTPFYTIYNYASMIFTISAQSALP